MRERLGRVVAALLGCGPAPLSAGSGDGEITGEPQVIASGLQVPWEVLPLPDGRILVSERPGRIRVIEGDGDLQAAPSYQSLGGQFLGLAAHPSYASHHFVYLYDTYRVPGGWRNRIRRFVDDGTTLTFSATILDHTPARATTMGAHRVRARRQALCDDRRCP